MYESEVEEVTNERLEMFKNSEKPLLLGKKGQNYLRDNGNIMGNKNGDMSENKEIINNGGINNNKTIADNNKIDMIKADNI